ncbi:hypothetical protein GCM10027066_11850 [Dyella jejuensis]
MPRLFAGVAGLALLAVGLSGVPTLLQLVLAFGVVTACSHALRRLRLPVCAVGWAHQGGWTLRGLDGTDDPAELLSFRIVRNAVLLRLAGNRYGKLTFWLLPDNSDPDIRRRLRMRLAVLRATAIEEG